VRLAVVQVGDVRAEVPVRAALCLSTLQTCAAAGADLDTALVDAVRGADGGGHTYVADRRPDLSGAISRPAE
jgi:hypothetical protein